MSDQLRLDEDPLGRLNAHNRYEIYDQLRDRFPVYRSAVHQSWFLTRYSDVSAALRDPDALAPDTPDYLRMLGERGGLDLRSLIEFVSSLSLFNRPPRHDALRRVLANALAGTRAPQFAARIDQKAKALLLAAAQKGEIDLASGFGRALALFVIGSFLGIPDDDISRLGELAHDLTELFERRLPSVRTVTTLNARAGSMADYFVGLIASRRRSPGDDGLSLIMHLAEESLNCSDRELAGFCTFFFMAAEETTSGAIASACQMTLTDDALRTRLTRESALIPNAAREFLRLVAPVQYVGRQFRSDKAIGGSTVPAGEQVFLMLGAANRDSGAFPAPDVCDLGRNGPEYLSFASGPYRCLGAQLATMEVEIALRNLLACPKDIRLSSEAPVWSARMNIAPLLKLKAEFH
jgi:cytochrome P450